MYTVNHLVSNQIISALGWTLVNILWQGFIIALLLGIFLRVFKTTSSQFRYIASLASLLIIVGLSIYNFLSSFDSSKQSMEQSISVISSSPDHQKTTKISTNIILSDQYDWNYILGEVKKIDSYFPVIVTIWLAGIFLFMLKFTIGLLYLQRLKHRSIQSINQEWINRFSRIEQKLQLDKGVRYIESRIVKIPLVLGYLKPMIIIPAGMLTGIPENQIEAIIAHELAHIRRNDFLVNIFQSIIEMIFFFHPAVWYISSQIRSERENCCDDIAITLCDGTITYAKALVAVQELNPGKVYSAVAFSGQQKKLLNRVKRVIMKPSMKSNLNDKVVATLIIVVGFAVASLSFGINAKSSKAATLDTNESYISSITAPPAQKTKVADVVKVKHVMPRDTATKVNRRNHLSINDNTVTKNFTDKDGKFKEMKFTLKNGNVSELYIDGKKIPENEYPNYQPKIDKTIADIKDAKEDIKRAMAEVEEIDFEKIRAEVEEAMRDVKIDMFEAQKEIQRSIEEAGSINIEEIMKDIQIDLQDLENLKLDEEIMEIQKSIADIQHINMEEIKQQMEEVKKQLENIDFDEIKQQIEKNRQQLSDDFDKEALQKEIQRINEELSNFDFDKLNLQFEENFKNIDKEEMLKEMEIELQKLEGLELEKK